MGYMPPPAPRQQYKDSLGIHRRYQGNDTIKSVAVMILAIIMLLLFFGLLWSHAEILTWEVLPNISSRSPLCPAPKPRKETMTRMSFFKEYPVDRLGNTGTRIEKVGDYYVVIYTEYTNTDLTFTTEATAGDTAKIKKDQ